MTEYITSLSSEEVSDSPVKDSVGLNFWFRGHIDGASGFKRSHLEVKGYTTFS